MKTLTTLEKTAFAILGGMIVVGTIMLLVQTVCGRSSDIHVLGTIDRISRITDRTIPTKANQKLNSDENQAFKHIPKLDVNTATIAQLDALPGIGKKLAEQIVELRKQKGGLKSIDELKEIKGISGKKFEMLSRHLCISGKTEELKKLDLNFATLEELEALPGVTPDLARAIFDARNAKGKFNSVKDLEDIPGLTEKKYKKFAPFIEIK